MASNAGAVAESAAEEQRRLRQVHAEIVDAQIILRSLQPHVNRSQSSLASLESEHVDAVRACENMDLQLESVQHEVKDMQSQTLLLSMELSAQMRECDAARF